MSKERTIKVEFPTDNDAKNETDFVVGQTGSGKTVLLFNLARMEDRAVIYDIMGEYSKCGVQANGIPAFIESLNEGQKVIVYQPVDEDVLTHEQQINAVADALFDFQMVNPEQGEVCFVIDEVSKVTTPNKWPQGLMDLLQRGRHFHIKKMLGTQWLSRIPAAMRDCASDWYVFRQVDYRAFEVLSQLGWPDEIVYKVSRLPDLTCIHFDGKDFEIVKLEPKSTTTNDATKRRIVSILDF